MQVAVISIIIGALGTISTGEERRLEEFNIEGRDHTTYNINKIGQNT